MVLGFMKGLRVSIPPSGSGLMNILEGKFPTDDLRYGTIPQSLFPELINLE